MIKDLCNSYSLIKDMNKLPDLWLIKVMIFLDSGRFTVDFWFCRAEDKSTKDDFYVVGHPISLKLLK